MSYDKKQETKVTPALTDIEYERKVADANIEAQKRAAANAEKNTNINQQRANTEERKVNQEALTNFEKLVANKTLLRGVQAEIQGYKLTGSNGLVNMNQLGSIMNKLGGYGFDIDMSDDGKMVKLIFPNGESGEFINLNAADASARIKTELLAGIISAANGNDDNKNQFELND
jgi:hypothetical protein